MMIGTAEMDNATPKCVFLGASDLRFSRRASTDLILIIAIFLQILRKYRQKAPFFALFYPENSIRRSFVKPPGICRPACPPLPPPQTPKNAQKLRLNALIPAFLIPGHLIPGCLITLSLQP
jgi:hypothetical protein